MSYIDNEILERLIGTMVEGFARIEKKLDQMNRLKECMNGDRLLDNVDLAELLGVSQRTLARYRQEGKIKYYSVEKNGKSFYLASEIISPGSAVKKISLYTVFPSGYVKLKFFTSSFPDV